MNTATATRTASDTDSITRSILINAPRERVWRALTKAEEFGAWFGADLAGQTFAPGQRARGRMGEACGHKDAWFDVVVDTIDPMDRFAFRWHPYALDPKMDYSAEEPTLITFTLSDAAAGTKLTVVESGFDKLPPQRRLEAFPMHEKGWEIQLANVARHAAA